MPSRTARVRPVFKVTPEVWPAEPAVVDTAGGLWQSPERLDTIFGC